GGVTASRSLPTCEHLLKARTIFRNGSANSSTSFELWMTIQALTTNSQQAQASHCYDFSALEQKNAPNVGCTVQSAWSLTFGWPSHWLRKHHGSGRAATSTAARSVANPHAQSDSNSNSNSNPDSDSNLVSNADSHSHCQPDHEQPAHRWHAG